MNNHVEWTTMFEKHAEIQNYLKYTSEFKPQENSIFDSEVKFNKVSDLICNN